MLSVPSYTRSNPPLLSAPSLIPNPYSPQVILIPIPLSNSRYKSTPTPKTTTTPAQRPSHMMLPFLHDTNVPFGDSSQGGPTSKQGKKADMSAYLEKWDDKWKEMKKE
jgi:hypothetical protein